MLKQINMKAIWCISSILGLILILLSRLDLLTLPIWILLGVFLGLVYVSIKRPKLIYYGVIFFLPFEEFNIVPSSIPFDLRIYQILLIAIVIGYFIRQILSKTKITIRSFRLDKLDLSLLSIGAISIFAGYLNSPELTITLKKTAVYFFYLVLYFVIKHFLRNKDVLKKSFQTILVSSFLVSGLGLVEMIFFKFRETLFFPTTFLGRPDSVIIEPDWLGFYTVFVISIIISWQLLFRKDVLFSKKWINIILALNISVLILAWSRSAWLAFLAILIILVLGLFLMDFLPKFNLDILKKKKTYFKVFRQNGLDILKKLVIILVGALLMIQFLGLAPMSLSERLGSIFGQEKIYVAISPNTGEEYIIEFESDAEYWRESGFIVKKMPREDINIQLRIAKTESDIELFKENPLIGSGFGFSEIRNGEGNTPINIFFDILVSTGLMGLVVYSYFWGQVVLSAVLPMIKHKKPTKRGLKAWLEILLRGWPVIIVGSIGLAALMIPNLFNDGLTLGFVWLWIAILIAQIEVYSSVKR